MRRIDLVGASIRLSGTVSPYLRARLDLARQRRAGDAAIRVTERLLRPGDVALDVGARWGTYMVLLGRAVGPNGAVHVFEPNPLHEATLRSIARRLGNAVVHSVALSDEAGDAELHVPVIDGSVADGLASLTPSPNAHHTVHIRRQRLDELALERCDFVKCDVEGHELAVLRGAEQTLRRLRPTLLVEIEQRHPGADLSATLAFVAGLGYAGFAIHRDGLRPVDEFDVEQHQLRPLRELPARWMMSPDYVHDFVFIAPGGPAHERLADEVANSPSRR